MEKIILEIEYNSIELTILKNAKGDIFSFNPISDNATELATFLVGAEVLTPSNKQ